MTTTTSFRFGQRVTRFGFDTICAIVLIGQQPIRLARATGRALFDFSKGIARPDFAGRKSDLAHREHADHHYASQK